MDPSQSSDVEPTAGAPEKGAAALGATEQRRRTLPPPEWLGLDAPRSAASVTLERYTLAAPIARRRGARAELEALAARIADASQVGDEEAERAAASALARTFAALGTELDQATKLARRALLLGDDPALRDELSGWFAMLGEPALAAATLRPLLQDTSGSAAADVLLRIGTLLARAGEARAAREAFEQALAESANDAAPAELVASLAAWAPGAVSPEEAAEFYLQAAERRGRNGERGAAFENALRGFEVAPGVAVAAERLAQQLVERGRAAAADEVRREHARHAGPTARAVHLARERAALAEGDAPRALGAALDARLDCEIDLKSVAAVLVPHDEPADAAEVGFDELLERLGLHDLLAARLELACELFSGRERASVRVALARLFAGPLARPDRAVEAFLEALVADPGNDVARQALQRHATSTRDHSPLVEALVRIGESGAVPLEREAALRELYRLADERLQDANLMVWSARLLASIERGDPALMEAAERLGPRLGLSDDALAQLSSQLTRVEAAERIEPLSRVASLLLSRPGSADQLLPVLLELCELAPEERSFQVAVERVLSRQARFEELEAFYDRLLSRSASASERARIAPLLSAVRRRRGDIEGALAALAPLVDEAGSYPAALSMAALLAGQRGDDVLRARALLRLALVLAAPLRAVLCAVAGEALLRAGELEAARKAVDQAVAADPSLARPAAARAAVGVATCDRWGAQAMERAMGVVVPRAELCSALAMAYDRLDEPSLAFAFCLRRIALRPGDLSAARDRLERALSSGEGARLADTLAWLLAQPQPLSELTELVARALRALAGLEPGRAAALARRALDVMGPRSTDLRLAIWSAADVVGERGLAIACSERWLASGAPSSDRQELLLDLSRRRRAAGDADGAARALMRAVRDGAWATSVLAELDVALPPRGPDGEIALLFARAEALSGLSEADQRGTARAWRELGAAYWDLAGDERTALKAWEHAAALDLESGLENLASDLLSFAGPEAALARLEEIADRRTDPALAARMLGLAATIALELNKRSRALSLAGRSLELDPSRADVLAVVERAVDDQSLDVLERLYQRLAELALGRYGERAVHYRAARQFEKRKALERGFGQALQAFDAVPSEGAVFATMVRLGERTGQTSEVIRAIERVAAQSRVPEQGSAWLRRAAMLAGPSEEGLRQRVEVLLRALLVRPEVEVLSGLGRAAAQLSELVPDEKPILELRLWRALDRLLAGLSGPEGARVALTGARVMLEVFDAVDSAMVACERALACDPDVDEFSQLDEFAERFAPVAAALIEATKALAWHSGVAGVALLGLAAKLCSARGEPQRAAEFLRLAAERDPENEELRLRADHATRASADDGPAEPPKVEDPVVALLEIARAAEAEGDDPRAAALLEEAREKRPLAPEAEREIVERLLALYERTGQAGLLEDLLEAELALEDVEPARRVSLARRLSLLATARGDASRALVVLSAVQPSAPDDIDLLRAIVGLARSVGDYDQLVSGLTLLLGASSEPAECASLLREVAEIHERLGNFTAASRAWSELMELDPRDTSALSALEREAERASDYDSLIRLLARRASLATTVDEVRRIRLRRASVLEQRLGRADEARGELEALTLATGDHLSVLRVLADLNERLGAPLRAAPLWLRASAVTSDRDEAAELSLRACETYLLAGDVESARRVLDSIQIWSPSERVLTLATEIERRRQDPLALAEALDDLSSVSSSEPEQRAALLFEAAEASLAGGATELALARAERATRLFPTAVGPQLLARSLEYRRRGAGSREDAETTVVELSALGAPPSAEEAELLAFLLAEALEVAGEAERALETLERVEAELPGRPLVVLGLAERLSRKGATERALACYDAALGGDLRGLRGRGRVAWGAAEIARRTGDMDRTSTYLEVAADDAETREQATALIREIFSERVSSPPRGAAQRSTAPPAAGPHQHSDPAVPVIAPLPPVASLSGERARVSLGLYSEKPPLEAAEEHVILPGQSARAPTPSAEPAADLTDATPIPGAGHSPGRYSVRPPGSDRAEGEPAADAAPPPAPQRHPSSSSKLTRLDEDEAALYSALAGGSADAGRELIAKLENRPDRSHDLVAACRRLLITQPSDWALRKLHRAALSDKNFAYVRAIEHVLGVLDPAAERVEPPVLDGESEQPDAVRALLLRDHASPVFEALALVWEGAEHVFRRDPSAYGVTGLERVPLGAPTPLARAYSSVARSVGMPRTPLFQRRSAGTITVSLALLSPPSVVLSGDVRQETAELRFHLGAMLLASMPQLVLLLGSPESQARAILKGLAFAFGPPQAGAPPGAVPNLAEVLWESIPARLQRRLREICTPEALDYESAVRLGRSVTRRAGLFSCGDLGVALLATCAEEGIPDTQVKSFSGLAELFPSHPGILSLFLLATSAEYAQIRWLRGRARNSP